jgi:signal transduction histidine kinase/DNA-binding NarL/FixJ family response regulator
MKTILVLATTGELAGALTSGLNPARYRIVARQSVEEAEPLLARGLALACILDAEPGGVQDLWAIERLAKISPHCPILVHTASQDAAWQEQAYVQGASHIIRKPAGIRALESILDRELEKPKPTKTARTVSDVSSAPAPLEQSPAPAISGLGLIRDFSAILTHSHNTDELLKQVLQMLRQTLAVNRAAIFLRAPSTSPDADDADTALRPTAFVGFQPEVLSSAQLSLACGIGAQLSHSGRILRASSAAAQADAAAQNEFETIGAAVAVPMLDRGRLLGVAVFDGRITGETLTNPELELMYHLLEHAALAVRNIWMHAQQTANHELLTAVLRELSSACIVASRNLRVLHANKTALKLFATDPKTDSLDFTELPPTLAAKIYQVFKTGAALMPYRFESGRFPGSSYHATILPFQRDADGSPASVLLTIEDQTQSEQLRRLELEASDLRMVKNMANRLVAETGNAIVPLNTFVQIPPDAMDRSLLDTMLPALKDTDKRIERRVKQFRYLAEDVLEPNAQLSLQTLAEKAFAEAQHYLPSRNAQLVVENAPARETIHANRERLTFALAEIFMNALQANTTNPVLTVRRVDSGVPATVPTIAIEIRDNGPGFSKEASEKVGKHFFTTRIPGLGLGLAVAKKIIEAHGGSLEIVTPENIPHGIVRIKLPLTLGAEVQA